MNLLLALAAALGFQAPKEGPAVAAKSPEDAYRAFVVAVLSHDEKTLRAVALPNEELDWLLKGQKAPALMMPIMKAQFAKKKVRRLEVGETITLPGKRTYTVTDEDVAEGRAMIQAEGDPIPLRCREVEEAWKVDASPMIAARKAADRARKAAEERRKRGESAG